MLLLVLLLASTAAAWAGDGVTLKLEKNLIKIGTFYNGTTIEAQGSVPNGAEVVIRVTGHPEDLALKKKGKVLGLLWMNVSDITFKNAPEVYMLYSSDSGQNLLEDPKYEFSFPALERRIEIEPAGEDFDFLFGEFIKLKEKEETYASFTSAVHYPEESDSGRAFSVTLNVPPKMKKGDYKVDLFAVKDGKIVGSASTDLKIEYVGLPKFLDDLAFQHALLYGILAAGVAIAAGLIIGSIFKGGGGH
jgi:hypothetical protein